MQSDEEPTAVTEMDIFETQILEDNLEMKSEVSPEIKIQERPIMSLQPKKQENNIQ